jgi:segregation and condensation protein A
LSDYRVELEVYNGPLDLLLFLIRREEVDIHDIPISRITEQYLAYVNLLRQLDPEAVSEFLVMAATLTEIKSRTLLPRPPAEEGEEEVVDPRLELVRQLLLYKAFKDAARSLEHAAGEQAMRHARSPASPVAAADEMELENLELWDLFDAFNRLLEQIGRGEPYHEVAVDDTPMALHAADIVDSIERCGGSQRFEEVFLGRTRGEMIGLFLALLELMRQRRVRASQDEPFGPILIYLLDATPLEEMEEAGGGEAFAEAEDPEVRVTGVGDSEVLEAGAMPEAETTVQSSREEERDAKQDHVEEHDHESQ